MSALRLFTDGSDQPMPKPAKDKTTWLTPYANAWLEFYGGIMDYGCAARYLKPVETIHGPAKTLAHFRSYLERTEAKFVSIKRFHETFGAWDPNEAKKGKKAKKSNDEVVAVLRNLSGSPHGCYLGQRFNDVGFNGLSEVEQSECLAKYRKFDERV